MSTKYICDHVDECIDNTVTVEECDHAQPHHWTDTCDSDECPDASGKVCCVPAEED